MTCAANRGKPRRTDKGIRPSAEGLEQQEKYRAHRAGPRFTSGCCTSAALMGPARKLSHRRPPTSRVRPDTMIVSDNCLLVVSRATGNSEAEPLFGLASKITKIRVRTRDPEQSARGVTTRQPCWACNKWSTGDAYVHSRTHDRSGKPSVPPKNQKCRAR